MMTDVLEYDIVVTTYEIAKNPAVTGLFRSTHFNLCVLDEGHVIKSLTSQVGQAVRRINNINGGLEYPAYKGGLHAAAIEMRLNPYCHAASQLGLDALSSLEGCKGITGSYKERLVDRHCPYCERHADKWKLSSRRNRTTMSTIWRC